ncbi:MAG: translocation/assembly module TamB domain-containing protein, partial [Bacteroidota bacterium]
MAEQKSSSPVINLRAGLSGNGNQFLAEGTYNINTTGIDLRADIQQFPMILVDPFTAGSLRKSSGYIAGEFDVTGTTEAPKVDGYLEFRDAATNIVYLQTRYSIPDNQRISINNQRIDFGRLRLLDSKQQEATLSGNIQHRFFQSFNFALNFKTDQFRFLNTTAKDNDLFYGTLNLSADVDIRGTLELPQIGINARTLAGSQLYVSTILEETVGQQASYIIFGEPGADPLDSILNVRLENNSYTSLAINLLLNLELTPDAELIVVVDPSTGDQLSCRGNADVTVQMNPVGEVNVSGVYTVVSGQYNFNYQGLVRRAFDLVPGGRLNFVGDPLDTRFDLSARYSTRTSVYALIGNESSLSESALREARDRHDVSVSLSMRGDLNQPVISFDLSIPELNNSSLNTTIDRKLQRLQEDEAELNKQVFGLLLLNSFVAEQSATAVLIPAVA